MPLPPARWRAAVGVSRVERPRGRLNEGRTATLDREAQLVGRRAGQRDAGRLLMLRAAHGSEPSPGVVARGAAHGPVHPVLDAVDGNTPPSNDERDVDRVGRPSVLAWFLRLRRATRTVRSLPRSVALGRRRNSGLRSGGFFARPFHASALPPLPPQQFPAHDPETELGCRNILGRPSHTARCDPRARPPSGRHAGSGTG